VFGKISEIRNFSTAVFKKETVKFFEKLMRFSD